MAAPASISSQVERGEANVYPMLPERDAKGPRMAIWA
jgi:hypothetical protein